MDAYELLLSWPEISTADSETLLNHPAWRMDAAYGDEEVRLAMAKPVEGEMVDELLLAVNLDSVPHVLGIRDSAAFPDLHLLWRRKGELPEALVVALVEKDAGALLQLVENIVRKELRIVGLVTDARKSSAGRRSFAFRSFAGEVGFSLDIPQDALSWLGVLDNLDVGHDSIRGLTRPVRAEYAVIGLDEDSVATLVAGDYLLTDGGDARWIVELPDDESLRICAQDEAVFSFSDFADDMLPPVPPPGNLLVFRHARQLATAEAATVGDSSAVKIASIC